VKGRQYQNKSCKLHHLPVGGTGAEPCVWASNLHVVEAVRMYKEAGYRSVWRPDPEHIECIEEAFCKRKSEAQKR